MRCAPPLPDNLGHEAPLRRRDPSGRRAIASCSPAWRSRTTPFRSCGSRRPRASKRSSARSPPLLPTEGLEAIIKWPVVVTDAAGTVRSGFAGPDFLVELDVDQYGTATPGRRDVVAPLEAWLARLDADELLEAERSGAEPETTTLTFAGWHISFAAIPLRLDLRGLDDHRVLGAHGEGIAQLDDITPLRRKLKRKATTTAISAVPTSSPSCARHLRGVDRHRAGAARVPSLVATTRTKASGGCANAMACGSAATGPSTPGLGRADRHGPVVDGDHGSHPVLVEQPVGRATRWRWSRPGRGRSHHGRSTDDTTGVAASRSAPRTARTLACDTVTFG